METALSVVDAATAMWGGHRRPTASERLKLAERAAEALSQGARQTDLVHALSRDLSDARSAVAVVMARTAAADWWRGEVAPAAVAASATLRPEWCGVCDERTRQREDAQGRPYRCPECHPLRGDAHRRDDGQGDAEVTALDVIELDQVPVDDIADGAVIDLRAYQRG